MEEQRIDIDTAILANKLGFNIQQPFWYRNDFRQISTIGFYETGERVLKEGSIYCEAPTQALLSKWLREKYNIYIVVYPVWDGKCDFALYNEDEFDLVYDKPKYTHKNSFGTYEETLEIALKIAMSTIE